MGCNDGLLDDRHVCRGSVSEPQCKEVNYQITMSFSGGKIMKRRLLVLLIVAAFVTGAQAYAHHSFAATYFEDKTVKIEGKLVQFLFRNPHSFVHVEAPDESGVMQRWAVEWGGAGQLGG